MTDTPSLAAVPDLDKAEPTKLAPKRERVTKPAVSSPLVKRRIEIDTKALTEWATLLATVTTAQVDAAPVVAQIGGVVSALRDAVGIARTAAAEAAGIADHRLAKIEAGEAATLDETMVLFAWVEATANEVGA